MGHSFWWGVSILGAEQAQGDGSRGMLAAGAESRALSPLKHRQGPDGPAMATLMK